MPRKKLTRGKMESLTSFENRHRETHSPTKPNKSALKLLSGQMRRAKGKKA